MPGVSPMANGKFPKETIERLEYAGAWLRVNGEAIYDTRPWNLFNEGDNLRFTANSDGKHIYAIALKWPDRSLTIRSARAVAGSRITMLGTHQTLQWRQDIDGLVIELPDALAQHKPCEQAFVFKIKAQPFRLTYS